MLGEIIKNSSEHRAFILLFFFFLNDPPPTELSPLPPPAPFPSPRAPGADPHPAASSARGLRARGGARGQPRERPLHLLRGRREPAGVLRRLHRAEVSTAAASEIGRAHV